MLWKLLYYLIGYHLPASYEPFGILGKYFRALCASHMCKFVGENINIEPHADFDKSLSIGDNSGIGKGSCIGVSVQIGNNVLMGPECYIFTVNHSFDTSKRKYVGITLVKPVIIEDDVWIGARVTILPGVLIGKGSTLGAGAVVSKDISPYSVAVGNPAKVIKSLL
jgi:acetyltransferase-like isoleucine patch superfamily enzyme